MPTMHEIQHEPTPGYAKFQDIVLMSMRVRVPDLCDERKQHAEHHNRNVDLGKTFVAWVGIHISGYG